MENVAKFSGRALKIARESRGLTRSGLATCIGISTAAISKMEVEQIKPSMETFNAICHALKYPVSFFESSISELSLPPAFYRKRKSVSVRDENQIRAMLSVRIECHIRNLVKSVDIPEPALGVYEFPGEMELFTRDIRTLLGVPNGPIKSLIQTLEDNGILIVDTDFGGMKIDAVSFNLRERGLPSVIFVNRSIPGDRQKWSIAHELGHLVLHHSYLESEKSDIEKEADSFASSFLMPRNDFIPQFPKFKLRFENWAALKMYWGLSIQAIARRAKDLGRIKENEYKDIYKMLPRMGYGRLHEPITIEREQPRLLREIISYHISEMGMGNAELASELRLTEQEYEELYQSTAGRALKLLT